MKGDAMQYEKGSLIVMFLLALLMLALWPTCHAHAQVLSWPLAHTAPGDDGTVGTASNITVFYSATQPDTTGAVAWLDRGGLLADTPAGIQTWRNQAKNKPGPLPLVAGSLQTYAIADTFQTGVKYWAEVKTCDDGLPALPGATPVPNCSYSNLVAWVAPAPADVRAPAAVRDLKTRAEFVSP